MQGYDITKVEIQQEDEERENMEQLSVEELRQLISMNDKGDNIEKKLDKTSFDFYYNYLLQTIMTDLPLH